MTDEDAVYVRAREVLLDAAEALQEHRDSVVLVGAQAIYVRVGEGDLPVAPYTSDADLGVDPRALEDTPLLADALETANLKLRRDAPGVWLAEDDVQVDLLVPQELAGRPGRRAADLGPHGRRISRQVKGLSAAVVGRSEVVLEALDPSDPRSVTMLVAGKAGLLVSKLHKISERQGTNRQKNKDALDVLRLLQGSEPGELAADLHQLRQDEVAGAATEEAVVLLPELFGSPDSTGSKMAGEAAGAFVPPGEIEASCSALATELLHELESSDG
jgi:hypothetical protein